MAISEQFINTPDYSTFDLGSIHRTTFDMGQLVPISTIPTLPGDKINISIDAFIRGMPTISPIMDKVDVKINHFFVPYRILWEKFPDMLAQSQKHLLVSNTPPTMPRVSSPTTPADPNYPAGRLADYLGISKYWKNTDKELSAMPWLAYQKIYLDWYVPQRWKQYLLSSGNAHEMIQLERDLEIIKTNTGGSLGVIGHATKRWEKLQNVGWNHDYFTNALPMPSLFGDQKIPLFNSEIAPNENDHYFENEVQQQGYSALNFSSTTQNGIENQAKLATIRDLRKSIAVQHYLEKLNYSGGNYYETLKVMWNQDIDDQTLQRSDYVGGDVFPLFVNEVESTSGTAQNALGDLAGKPLGTGSSDNEYYECDEYGIFMTIAHVVNKRSYSDAMSKALFGTLNVYDFPNPAFEGIGDEAVFAYELNGKNFTNDNIFGYVPRYSNWKTSFDRISGEFRNSLKHWHLGENAETMLHQQISPEFITANPRSDIFVVPGEPDKLMSTFKIDAKVQRKLQVNPIAGLGRI